MQKHELVSIRLMRVEDEGFVYTTWLKGLRYANSWFENIDQDAYFKNYHAVIERILQRPNTKAQVACLKDEDDVIIGYSVTEPNTLHWVFVRPDWRKIGIAKDLVPRETNVCTHLTKLGLILKPKAMIFDPFRGPQ